MDPLSGVVSIFAVISLAIQLAGTAQDIKNFISSIQDAPKELDRLTNQLDQLYTIAHGIRRNSVMMLIRKYSRLSLTLSKHATKRCQRLRG